MSTSQSVIDTAQGQVPELDYYVWDVPGNPVSAQIKLELIAPLAQAAVDCFKSSTALGSEIGGVLLGRVIEGASRRTTIEAYELIPCQYERGPLYMLSDTEKAELKGIIEKHQAPDQPLAVVGFFRSKTSKKLALDENDRSLMEEFFPGPEQIALLVKPFSMREPSAGIFVWENGSLSDEPSALEFPFGESKLRGAQYAKSIVKWSAATAAAAVKPKQWAPGEKPSPAPAPAAQATPIAVEPPVQAKEPAPSAALAPEPEPVIQAPVASAVPVVEPVVVAAAKPEPTVQVKPAAPAAPVVEPVVVAAAKPEPAAEVKPVAPAIPVVEPVVVAAAKPEPVVAVKPVAPAVPVVEPVVVAAAKPEPAVAAKPVAPAAPVVEPVVVAAAKPEPAAKAPAAPATPVVEPKVLAATEPTPPMAKPATADSQADELRRQLRAAMAARPAAAGSTTAAAAPARAEASAAAAAPAEAAPASKRKSQEPVTPTQAHVPEHVPEVEEVVEPNADLRVELLRTIGPGKIPDSRRGRPLLWVLGALLMAVKSNADLRVELLRSGGAGNMPQPKRGHPLAWSLLVLLLLAGIGGAGYYWKMQHGGFSSKPPESVLALHVDKQGSSLRLIWNRDAEVVRAAQKATLLISDGVQQGTYQLDATQLHSGGLLYEQITPDVSFKLEVIDPNTGKPVTDSFRVLAGLRASDSTPAAAQKGSSPTSSPSPASTQNAQNAQNTPAPAPAKEAAAKKSGAQPTRTFQAPAAVSLADRVRPLNLELPNVEVAANNQLSGAAGLAQAQLQSNRLPAPPPPSGASSQAAPQAAPQAATPAATKGAVRTTTVTAPVLLKRVDPVYPPLAKTMNVSGKVVIDAVVGKDGRVRDVRAVEGNRLLSQAAEEAVRKWTYKPGELNGQPQDRPLRIELIFSR